MGGIGKTVTSTSLFRDDQVRAFFDQIVFLPLGQKPNIDKVRSNFFTQLTGLALKVDLSDEEKAQEILKATLGRKILLYLDDIWAEEHAKNLDLLDSNSASVVLVSTRIRGLCGTQVCEPQTGLTTNQLKWRSYQVVCAQSVEIKQPTEDEAIAILVAAAGLPLDSVAPKGAAEIVRFCGFLPLSLAMAGRLVNDLQLGSDWSGVCEILRDELRDNQSSSHTEHNIIRASLAALGGGSEGDSIRSLFKLFALVPEDTYVPLEVLSMMLEAVHTNPNRSTVAIPRNRRRQPSTPRTRQAPQPARVSLLKIRRWLKILQDRSLVLGSIDRPMVHDLVKDFVEGLHSEEEMRRNQEQVVKTLIANRTVSDAGVVGWSMSNRGDSATSYVFNEVQWHVALSQYGERGEASLLEWATDITRDCITYAAAGEMGIERITMAAEDAEASGKFCDAALRWDMAGYHRRNIEGNRDDISAGYRVKAVQACIRIKTDAAQNEARGDYDADELHLIKFEVAAGYSTNNVAMYLEDTAETVAKMAMPLIKDVLNGPVVATRPFEQMSLTNTVEGWLPAMQDADLLLFSEIQCQAVPNLMAQCETSGDPTSRDLGGIVCSTYDTFMDLYTLHENFDWSKWPIDACANALSVYDFRLHNQMLKSAVGQDYGVFGPMAASAGLHRGNISLYREGVNVHRDIMRQIFHKDDSRGQWTAYLVDMWSLVYFMLGDADKAVLVHNEGVHHSRSATLIRKHPSLYYTVGILHLTGTGV
jgi:hypothetical protein